MRIFDPVHGLIDFGGTEQDGPLAGVIDTAAFQRLRRIRQLGLSDLVYPGATHSRFAHSIGVFKNARDLLAIAERELEKAGEEYDEERARAARLAALLHDIGHGPFSHVFESALADIAPSALSHEKWSARILREDEALAEAVAEAGRAWGCEGLARSATELFEGGKRDLYAEVVSSQFDADRMDYLARDARATGVDVGNFEREWLLDCLHVAPSPADGRQGWIVDAKGRQAVEAYILARFQLHEIIYQHPTTWGYEILFARLLRALHGVFAVGGEEPVYLALLAAGEAPSVRDYLALDDAVAWALIAGLARMEESGAGGSGKGGGERRELGRGCPCSLKLGRGAPLSPTASSHRSPSAT